MSTQAEVVSPLKNFYGGMEDAVSYLVDNGPGCFNLEKPGCTLSIGIERLKSLMSLMIVPRLLIRTKKLACYLFSTIRWKSANLPDVGHVGFHGLSLQHTEKTARYTISMFRNYCLRIRPKSIFWHPNI